VTHPWLSIVIPTVGRAELLHTLDAIDAQPEDLLEGVEVLVVGDTFGGRSPQLEQAQDHVATQRPPSRYQYLEYDGGQHCYGHPQRTYGATLARGEWVWFGQDDNVASDEALRAIRAATSATAAPSLCVFRTLCYWRQVVWREPRLELGNVDADCLVMRRELAAAVRWGLRYEGDYDAAVAAAKLSETVGWHEDLVSIARPDQSHRWWLDA
jgi:hypothetical protein